MAIWQRKVTDVEELNVLSKQTLAQFLDMKFIKIGDDYLTMQMPVNDKTHQPYGLLHGGASAALAETVGSVASSLCIDTDKKIFVGIEINCNHIRGVRQGMVYATARPLHVGLTTHVWDIRILNEREKLICVSRLTVAILNKPKA